MHVYLVTGNHVALGKASGRSGQNLDVTVRAFARVKSPKTGGAVDMSAARVARQFRDKYRRFVREVHAAGGINDHTLAQALTLLKLARVDAIASVVEHTGAFTLPVPGFGAVVMEGEDGAVGKLATAGVRVERRMASAASAMRGRALEAAREDARALTA